MKIQKYRFAPKVYWRWYVPISREGWVVILLMVVIIVVWSEIFFWDIPWEEVTSWMILLYVIGICGISILPLILFRKRMKWLLKRRRLVKDIDWKDEM